MTKNTQPDTAWAFDLLWIGFLAIYAFIGYTVTPFHGDESMQIFMSRDYAYQFIDGNIETLYYDDTRVDDVEQGLRLLNGTLNKYTIGLAWHLGGYEVDDLNVPWFWELDYQYNMDNNFYPGDDLLLTSRIPSALFLALSVVMFYLAAKTFAMRPAAYIATTLYALNPAVLINGRRAMMEGSLLFGGLFALYAGVLLAKQRGWQSWLSAALLAVATGIAVASKHTNVVVVFAIFLGLGLHALFVMRTEHIRAMLTRLAQLLVAGVLSIGVFLALNPAWWDNPIEVAQVVYHERVNLLEGQIAIFDGYENRLEQAAGFYRQVFVNAPMYYEADDFAEPLAPKIVTYESTPYAGVQLPGASLIMAILATMGALILLRVLRIPDIQPDTHWVVGTWAAIVIPFTWFATPLMWQRYYLIAYPVVHMLVAIALVWVFRTYARDATENSPQYKRGSARRVKPNNA